MAGPKSDKATIEARRCRLNELLAEGKTPADAAPILRAEGFPASHDAVEKDVEAMSVGWRERNAEAYGAIAAKQYAEQQADKRELDELRITLGATNLSPEKKIALSLDILKQRESLRDQEMKLTGSAAPTRSVTAHVDAAQLDPLYLDIRGVLQDLEEDDQQTALGLLREFAATKVKAITIDSKQLEAHNEADTKLS
jgi:hypothetical protein